jgi:hypothetical protein
MKSFSINQRRLRLCGTSVLAKSLFSHVISAIFVAAFHLYFVNDLKQKSICFGVVACVMKVLLSVGAYVSF